jgi:GNAT superfamily N-acetyltransferase
MMSPSLPTEQIFLAATPELVREVRALFKEYASSLGLDLSFQDFAAEMASLPGIYAPPDGVLLVAMVAGRAAGCVGVRRFGPEICEMKRHYVRHPFRGKGLGRRLSLATLDRARELGYRSMYLDTLPWMREALGLYQSLGFAPIPAYRVGPVAGTVFLGRELT